MNVTTALKTTSEHGGPVVLGAGMALFAVALVASGHGRVAAAPHPGPTVTTTVTVPAPGPAATTVVARPSGPTPAATVVPVSDARAAMPHTSSGGLSHGQARPPSAPQARPSTTPSPSPAATPCGGRILSVRALERVCLSIGR